MGCRGWESQRRARAGWAWLREVTRSRCGQGAGRLGETEWTLLTAGWPGLAVLILTLHMQAHAWQTPWLPQLDLSPHCELAPAAVLWEAPEPLPGGHRQTSPSCWRQSSVCRGKSVGLASTTGRSPATDLGGPASGGGGGGGTKTAAQAHGCEGLKPKAKEAFSELNDFSKEATETSTQ